MIFLAVVSAIVEAATARSGGFDLSLGRLATPLGLGFLILMATEVLRVLDKAPDLGEEESGNAGE